MIIYSVHDRLLMPRATRVGWQWRTGSVALAIILCGSTVLPPPLHAGIAGIVCSRSGANAAPETMLAEQLIRTIPSGSSIILRPIRIGTAHIPERMSDQIARSLLNALIRTGGDRLVVQTRHYQKLVHDSLYAFFDANIESELLYAEVDMETVLSVRRTITRAMSVFLPDFEIRCNAARLPGSGDVTLKCEALRNATTMAEGEACFGVNDEPVRSD